MAIDNHVENPPAEETGKTKAIYFAHPVSLYDTQLELDMIKKLEELFPTAHIESPNQEIHQAGYNQFKRTHGSGMEYYKRIVLPVMDAVAAVPFEDGKWGAGVYFEMMEFKKTHRPVFIMDHSLKVRPYHRIYKKDVLTQEETRARLDEIRLAKE